jgi:hypothetical protein
MGDGCATALTSRSIKGILKDILAIRTLSVDLLMLDALGADWTVVGHSSAFFYLVNM